MSKTLGEVAQEAYEKAGVVDPAIAWEAAAQAVASRVVGLRRIEAEQAVIEAARELERELADDEVPPGKPREAWQRLHAVMEALDKAEAGDE